MPSQSVRASQHAPAGGDSNCITYPLVWPISESALVALVGMGMSDECIGHYYGVEVEAVLALRHRHGIGQMRAETFVGK